ncbi:MAG: hypothetical protein ACLS95_06570 [Clostridia bacterium]
MKKETGITLVSLVVTIIILIILAGISINTLVGDTGIITKAQQAKENTLLAQEEEVKQLNQLYEEIKKNETEQGDSQQNQEYIKYLNEIAYPEGMPLVPKMLDYECNVGKVIQSDNTSTTRMGWKIFNQEYYFGDITIYNDIDNSWQTLDNEEAYIEFIFNRPVKINRVEFIPSYTSTYGGVALKTAKLLLSNDGKEYKEASELISYPNTIDTALNWQEIKSNDMQKTYTHVRLYVNGSYTSSFGKGIAIREMQIYGWFQ